MRALDILSGVLFVLGGYMKFSLAGEILKQTFMDIAINDIDIEGF